ncbi:MAG: ABC transporter ATP-binding protein [Planctomycetes bacterium]|nr:ABC transporter ATP-binding protein [Planctomycetota bacterium]
MPVLELHDLRKSYRTPSGETQRVIDISRFEIGAGEQVALRGTSGSGKTTLLNLIAGILTPDGGTIRVGDEDLTALSEGARDRVRARRIGYIFQTFNLLQGYTALENVALGMMFGAGADADFARKLLERVGLGERMDYRPRELSVGQQQRVAVARALANRPQLVLADEPTGNLDPRHAAEALELIRSACREQQAALLLVSHDPAVLGAFDRVEDLEQLNRARGPVAEGSA